MATDICMTEGCHNRFPPGMGKLKRYLCDDCRREKVERMSRELAKLELMSADLAERSEKLNAKCIKTTRRPTQNEINGVHNGSYDYYRPPKDDTIYCKYVYPDGRVCGRKLAELNTTGECYCHPAKGGLPYFIPGACDDDYVCHHKGAARHYHTSEQPLTRTGYTAGE